MSQRSLTGYDNEDVSSAHPGERRSRLAAGERSDRVGPARRGKSGVADVFISYARASADQAHRVAKALRGLGYSVWRDDELPEDISPTQPPASLQLPTPAGSYS